jgi:hypothetical protein
MIVTQLVKNSPAFHGTRRFITNYVHRSPSLAHIQSHINAVHTITPISSRATLILSSHLPLGTSTDIVLKGFPTEISYAFLHSEEQLVNAV